jgi:tetratricopeptide (TPR) repeat protein
METYRLKSKLVENEREFIIQTANDTNTTSIQSTLYVNGQLTDCLSCPHPQEVNAEEVLSLVKLAHEEQKQEIEALLDAYRKALVAGDAESMFHLGTAFFHKRLYEEARELFQSAVGSNPEHHQALHYLGMTQLALNMVSEAIESCSTAVRMRPMYADYRNSLGEAFLAENAPQRAMKELYEAVRINLYYGDAYYNLGLAHVLEGMLSGAYAPEGLPASAVDCFKKASLINPEYESDLLRQALQTLGKSDFRQAYLMLLEVREARKEQYRREFASFYVKSITSPDLMSQEAIDERIRYLETEVKKNPTYVDLYTELGRCLLEHARQSWLKGIQQYRRSLEINPTLSKAQYCLDEAEREFENIRSALSKIAELS